MRHFFKTSRSIDNLAKRLLGLLDDAVVVTDSEMNIVFFNKESERLYGYKRDEVLGQPFSLLVPEHQRENHHIMIENFIKQDVAHKKLNEKGYILTGLRKGGGEFQTRSTLLKLEDKKRPYYAFSVKDISEDQKTEEELLRLATTDSLTGVCNRREFISISEREARRARRYNRALSIMIMDIDCFQDFNNKFGHMNGDKLLQRITHLCCNTLRNIDVFGRWSGGEFIVLMPETSAEEARIIAERLRAIVEDTVIDGEDEKLNCTISIGVAQFRKNENAIDAPVARAVGAVQEAKKKGRNKVCLFKDV